MRTRLLDVLQAAGGAVEHADGGDRGIDVPATVGVDPDPAVRTDRVADRLEPGLVVGEGLAGLGDPDLRRAAPAVADDAVGLLGPDRGHGHVDRDHAPQRSRPVTGRGLLGAAQPRLRDDRVVLEERAPLPSRPVLEEHALAHGDAAEAGPHGQGPDPHEPSRARVRSRSRSACRCRASGSSRVARAGAAPKSGVPLPTQSRAWSMSIPPTTKATTRLPHSGSGTPSTSAARTDGCSRSRAATAAAGR